jgi:hypothetical protein
MENRRLEKYFTRGGFMIFYSLSHIIRINQLKMIMWSVHVAYPGENRNSCRVFVEKPEGNGPLVMPGEERRIIFKQIFKKLFAFQGLD